MLLGVVWLTGLGALGAILHLQRTSDSEHRAQVLVQEVAKRAGLLPAIAFSASPGQGVSIQKAQARLVAARQELDELLGRLGEFESDAETRSLRSAVERYGMLMQRLIPAVRTGEADRLFGKARRPGGANFEITRELDAAAAKHSRDASRARDLASVGSAAAILLALLAFSITLLRVRRAQGEAERLAAENAGLYEHSRQESLTDALTELGNRRRLFEDMGGPHPSLGEQVALGLFDLDGFKSYNDSFGHPAGDGLLNRLGTRLAAEIGDQGRAYRMGGDEFCVVVTGDEPDERMAAAQRALSESGQGFDIRCSAGVATIPREAVDLERALQLADQRLYADKQVNRVAADPDDLVALNVRQAVLKALEGHRDLLHAGEESTLARATAERLGLPADQVLRVRLAADLHDIGKTAIPDSVLNKPGPLDESERDLMRRHALIGERILAAMPTLSDVAPIVRSSHERPDGGGYPDGLTHDEIPMASRIIAVVDAFFAMVSSRPYRETLSVSEAVRELRRGSGTQFDPKVVDAFVALIEDQRPPAAVRDRRAHALR